MQFSSDGSIKWGNFRRKHHGICRGCTDITAAELANMPRQIWLVQPNEERQFYKFFDWVAFENNVSRMTSTSGLQKQAENVRSSAAKVFDFQRLSQTPPGNRPLDESTAEALKNLFNYSPVASWKAHLMEGVVVSDNL